ncbi:MAG: hypothetical protein AB7U26_03820 [Sulfuricurvum sp.]|uniref:hypothetical protein n=1 Tax=Sulfuricurvum sp. IAE1 TaxID=2546102 RepID=UPI001404F971|nr:hypothetical protein [Sulfuricurvum sp. IAE1]MDX9965930.1 hypothetical protein [Sulfuricurvum sp.]
MKELCKLGKSDLKSDFKKIVKIVKNPKYICIKCARVAIEKKYLCEPEKMQ